MANCVNDPASEHRDLNTDHRGFSILDTVVAIAAFTVVAGVVIPSVLNEYEMARLADCRAEVELMKTAAFEMRDGGNFPTPDQFWAIGFPDAEEGDYYYIVDDRYGAKGHGNDLDGCDENDPDSSAGCCGEDIVFVVLCNHDHGQFGKYVYASNREPPTVVAVDGEDPGYRFWLSQNNSDGSRKVGRKPTAPRQQK